MFSRLLTPRLVSRPILAPIPLQLKSNPNQTVFAVRLFHSQKSLLNAAAAPPVAVGQTAPVATTNSSTTVDAQKNSVTLKGILDKYGGWYPLAGLTSVILLSKEILVLNEEGYQLFMTGFWLLFVGVFAMDYMRGPINEWAAESDKELEDYTQLNVEILEYGKKTTKNIIDIVGEMNVYADEYIGALKKAAKSNDIRNRLAAREALIQKLQSLKQREISEKQRAASVLLDEALQYVRAEIKNLSKEEKDAIINYSIRAISGEGKALPKSEDPILRLFTKFIESKAA